MADNGPISNDLAQQIDLAERGDAEAQNILGSRLATGRGVIQDECGAAYWYMEAVKKGYFHAKWNLATMIVRGEAGLPKYFGTAMLLIQQAADAGDDSACQFLSMCYEYGKFGMPINSEKSLGWKEKAYNTRELKPFGEELDVGAMLSVSFVKPEIRET